MKKNNKVKRIFFAFLGLLIIPFVIPEKPIIPVKGATTRDWNKHTFWFEPWGASGVHKGVDIFGDINTPVVAPTSLLILYSGHINRGGNVVIALGPKWRIHYFAHLSEIKKDLNRTLFAGETLGYLGNTGNAKDKPAHLHYSILTLVPYPWLIDFSAQGYKKAFYLNPIDYLAH